MRERQVHTLLLIAREVLSELDLERALRRVVEAGPGLTGARYAALGILDEEKNGLARFETTGFDAATVGRIGDLPRGRGVLGELIRDARPVRLDEVSSHPRSYGFPAEHPPMTSFLGVPVVIDGEAYGNLYLTDKEGGPFDEDDEEAVIVLAELLAIAVRNARRYTGTRGRAADLEQTVAALEATTEISRALAGATDLDVVLELIAKRGRALVSARTLVVALPERGRLAVRRCAGENREHLDGIAYDATGTIEQTALQTGEPQRWSGDVDRASHGQNVFGSPEVTAMAGLVMPLRFANRSIGVLVALDRGTRGPAFTAEDERLLQAFAFTAATAIATSQRVASERRIQRLAAAEEERRRWARELHDETLQGLAALRIMLSSARRSESRAELDAAVETAVAGLAREVESLRALITELRPATLDQLGLGAAVMALVDRLAHDGLDIDVDLDLSWEAGRAPARHRPELEAGVYRLVQEALTNVVKHADASHARVAIREANGKVEISVTDDGHGFTPSDSTGGFGLIGMSERVELLDGDMSFESSPGRGTTMTASIPIPVFRVGDHPPGREARSGT
jgi:signal transduction histidine kinase